MHCLRALTERNCRKNLFYSTRDDTRERLLERLHMPSDLEEFEIREQQGLSDQNVHLNNGEEAIDINRWHLERVKMFQHLRRESETRFAFR